MKKILVLVAAVAFSVATFAQTQSINMFHIGGNFSKFTGKDAGNGNKFNLGYQVGFTKDFGSFFSIEPGIFLIHKGNQIKGDIFGIEFQQFTHLNYLQIPINAKLNFEIGSLRLQAGAGIYGSVGLWGSYQTKVDGKKDKDQSDNINFFDEAHGLNPFDFGGQVFASIYVGRIGLTVGYQPGLMSIQRKPDDGDKGKVNNSSMYFSLSYAMGERQ